MLIFADGFDNYSTLTNFWDGAGLDCAIRLSTGQSRTGIGCMQVNSAAFGPLKTFANKTKVLVGLAANFSGAAQIVHLDTSTKVNIAVQVNADRSLSVLRGSGDFPFAVVIGTTAVNVFTFNTYNYVECKVLFSATVGTVELRCNGVLVLTLTGLKTVAESANQFCSIVQLMGTSLASGTFLIDDVYVLDWATAPNTNFLGPLKLYTLPPTANAAVAWTPLAGTNWSEVSEVPPDGDTSYNSSPNIGDVDQYVYPLTGVPAGSAILFVQHELDMKVDSGARSVDSVVNGAPAGLPTALSSGYHIYPTPYDTNPATGVAWVIADFPSNFGPKVTA